MKKLKVEIAESPAALAHGLMGREHLAENNGMLFKFQTPLEAKFWGKDTYIPLDIAFVNRDHKIIAIKHITPMSTRLINSDGECAMAIEANAGFFRKNNISVGDAIKVINGEEIEVEFQ